MPHRSAVSMHARNNQKPETHRILPTSLHFRKPFCLQISLSAPENLRCAKFDVLGRGSGKGGSDILEIENTFSVSIKVW